MVDSDEINRLRAENVRLNEEVEFRKHQMDNADALRDNVMQSMDDIVNASLENPTIEVKLVKLFLSQPDPTSFKSSRA